MSVCLFMKKMVGYGIAIGGIVIMLVGFGTLNLPLPILKTIKPQFIIAAGIIGIIIGVVLSLDSSKKKSRKKKNTGEDEIPIYEGTGKNRRIVGYRKG